MFFSYSKCLNNDCRPCCDHNIVATFFNMWYRLHALFFFMWYRLHFILLKVIHILSTKLSTSKRLLSSYSDSLRLPFFSLTCAFVCKSVKPCCVFVLDCKGHLFRLGNLYAAIARLAARSRVMPRLGGGTFALGASAIKMRLADLMPTANSRVLAFVVLYFSRLEAED